MPSFSAKVLSDQQLGEIWTYIKTLPDSPEAKEIPLIQQLKTEKIGIFLISHDIHDVFDLADRISVMLHGKLVGTVNKADVTTDEVLAMIIMGKLPSDVTPNEHAQLHS